MQSLTYCRGLNINLLQSLSNSVVQSVGGLTVERSWSSYRAYRFILVAKRQFMFRERVNVHLFGFLLDTGYS
jgi:hypothetical protein